MASTTGFAPHDSAERRPRRVAARLGTVCAAILAVAGLMFALGFVSFVIAVPKQEKTDVARADGIVALTGGAERLADAVTLLARGRASRLLITGVNPTVSEDELVRRLPQFAGVLDCCIDLDRRAANTLGNALETQRWARTRGFRSLIVVTSGYHMPRALMELERVLPDVTLIPFPVVTERLREGSWWRDPATARLLLSEYLKYVAAVAKLRIAPHFEVFSPRAADVGLRL